MKRKKFSRSDLMFVALALAICGLASLAGAQPPSSFHMSHRILHHQHQQQQQYQSNAGGESAESPLALSSTSYATGGGQQQQSAAAADATSIYNTRAPADQEDSPLSAASVAATDVAAGEEESSSAAGSSHSGGSPNNNNYNGVPIEDEPSESSIDGSSSESHDESADNSQEVPERNLFMDRHNSQLKAMHDLFERRQLTNNHNHNNQHHHHHQQLQSSQELSPISVGLEPLGGPGSPFSMPPFSVPNGPLDGPPAGLGPPHGGGGPKPPMANADNIDQGLGPALPFGLNQLPHLLGFQSPPPFDGPQRGDQSAHSNHHSVMPPAAADPDAPNGGGGPSQKVWPKIFRFTDGRINLSEFEKQKKIRLSSKNQHNTENHIESAPIMFDGRQLKRKSFLILHGGIFSR